MDRASCPRRAHRVAQHDAVPRAGYAGEVPAIAPTAINPRRMPLPFRCRRWPVHDDLAPRTPHAPPDAAADQVAGVPVTRSFHRPFRRRASRRRCLDDDVPADMPDHSGMPTSAVITRRPRVIPAPIASRACSRDQADFAVALALDAEEIGPVAPGGCRTARQSRRPVRRPGPRAFGPIASALRGGLGRVLHRQREAHVPFSRPCSAILYCPRRPP